MSQDQPQPTAWNGSPYPGLRAYTPPDAPVFFGRSAEVEALIARFQAGARLVAVVGASGVGKSSLIGAGLLPRLADGALPGSEKWLLPSWDAARQRWSGLRFTPGEAGDNPFTALLSHIVPLLQDSPRDLGLRLADEPSAIGDLLRRVLRERPDQDEALIIIDQFEELFTLVHERYLSAFVELLSQLVTPQEPKARVVLVIRADFYARCVEHPQLASLLQTTTLPLAAPTAAALTDIIIRPAEATGLRFEAPLDDHLLRDATADTASLPLLAYTLARLHQTSEDGQLSASAYLRLGGLANAISRTAEEAFAALDAEAQAALPAVFRELVLLDESGVAIPRRVSLNRAVRTRQGRRLVDALVAAGVLNTDQHEFTRRASVFGAAAVDDSEASEGAHDLSHDLGVRLATPIIQADDQATVEISHEVVLRRWERLARWVEDAQDDLRLMRQVRYLADNWRRANYDPALLLTGTRLEQARPWLTDATLTAIQQEYVSASTQADDRRRAEEGRAAKQVQRLGRVRTVALITVVLALLAGAYAGFSLADAQSRLTAVETRQVMALGEMQTGQAALEAAERTLTQLPQALAAGETQVAQAQATAESIAGLPLTLTGLAAELTQIASLPTATEPPLSPTSTRSPTSEPAATLTSTGQSLASMLTERAVTRTAQPEGPTGIAATLTTLTATATLTPTPDATLLALAADADYLATFGPVSGELIHNAEDTLVETFVADINVVDFEATARFYNPYATTEGTWDYGFFFRDSQGTQYRVVVTSRQFWEVTLLSETVFTTIASGRLPFGLLDVAEDAFNDLRLLVRGTGALLLVNDQQVAQFDTSALWRAGSVRVVTGAFIGNEITGKITRYEDFTVHELADNAAMPTPTASMTPVSSALPAVLGANRGEIAVGGGEVWTYEGARGDILRISVEADRPAQTGPDMERDLEGFDTLVIVRGPSGARITENDDIEDGIITNSLIRRLRLPSDGVYEIEVRSWADVSGGAYTLTLERVE